MLACAFGIALGLVGSPIPPLSWAVMLAGFAILQLAGAVLELRALQCVIALISGAAWVWAGASGITDLPMNPGDFSAWFLGIACLYAFVLHATRTVGVLHE